MSIIRGKDDDGVFVDTLGLQFGHDESDVVVEHLDHGGVFFLSQREGGVVREVGMKFWNRNGAVWELGRMVEKEGLVLVVANEIENAFDEDILGIGFPSGTHGFVSEFTPFAAIGIVVAGEFEFGAIAPEVGGVKAMAAFVIVVSFVKVPTKAGDALVPSEEATVELAELSGAIACLLSDLSEEDLIFGDRITLRFQFG